MKDCKQPGYGRNIEVTHEERQFILAICEEFASKESPRVKRSTITPSPSPESPDAIKQRET